MGALGWSVTPARNAGIDPAIPSLDGMSARQVPAAVRGIMAAVRRQIDAQGGALVTGGALNAYTVSTGTGLTELRSGIAILVKIDRTNTAPSTLNVDGLGPLPWVDAGGVPLQEGRLIEDRFYSAILDTVADGSAVAWRVQAGASTLDEIPGFSEARDEAMASAEAATSAAAIVEEQAATVVLRAGEVETARAQVVTDAAATATNAAAVASDRTATQQARIDAQSARDQAVSTANSQAPEYLLRTGLPASNTSPATLAAYVTDDPTDNGANIGRWTRDTPTSQWVQRSRDTVPGVARRVANIEVGATAVVMAKAMERCLDPTGQGASYIEVDQDGFLAGYTDADNRRWAWEAAQGTYVPRDPVVYPAAQTADGFTRCLDPTGRGAGYFEVDPDGFVGVYTEALSGRRWVWDGARGGYVQSNPDVYAAAQTADAFTRCLNPLAIPVSDIFVDPDGYLSGFVGLDGKERRWDGLGSSLDNYPVVTSAPGATSGTTNFLPDRLLDQPLIDPFDAGLLAAKIAIAPPDPTYAAAPAYACPPFDLVSTQAAKDTYGQPVSRGIFSGAEFRNAGASQTLGAAYMSTIVGPGESAEDKGYGVIYRVVGETIEPVLFMIPQGYPSELHGTSPGGYCNDVRVSEWGNGWALVTCPMAGAQGKRMTVWAFFIKNPATCTLGNVEVGPICRLGDGWCGIASRGFGHDRLVTLSNRVGWAETPIGNHLHRLLAFGPAKDRIVAEYISKIPDAPQDVPIEQGVVSTDFYEGSTAPNRFGRTGRGVVHSYRASTRNGAPGGQFWVESDNAGLPGSWGVPYRAPWPSVGTQAEITAAPDGRLVYCFNWSATRRQNLAIAVQVDQPIRLASSWRIVIIDARGAGGDADVSYPRIFFPRDAAGVWLPNRPISVWSDYGRNKLADGPDPAASGQYIGNGVLTTISMDDVIAGSVASLVRKQFPTHAPTA